MKILHAADLHIGDRRYGRFDPTRSINTRLDDQRRCLLHIAEVALEEGVSAAVLAGDIYHGRAPSPAEEDIFAEFVARLTVSNIHVFALAGNHERPAIPGRASPLTHIETLGIERFHLLSEPGITTVTINGETLSVAAVPWPHRHEAAKAGFDIKASSVNIWDAYISELVADLAARIPEGSTAILAAHLWTANVSGLVEKNIRQEPICQAQTIAREPFRYIALGHIHAHQQVWPEPPAVYSGSIDRTDFSEANTPKGAVIVEIGEEKTSWRFFETPARRFIRIEMDISNAAEPAETAAIKAKSHNIEDAIVQIVATQKKGDPPLDGRRLRPKLPEPFFLRVIRRELGDDSLPPTLKAYDPLGALAEYIDSSPNLQPEKDKLIALARQLAEEVRGG